MGKYGTYHIFIACLFYCFLDLHILLRCNNVNILIKEEITDCLLWKWSKYFDNDGDSSHDKLHLGTTLFGWQLRYFEIKMQPCSLYAPPSIKWTILCQWHQPMKQLFHLWYLRSCLYFSLVISGNHGRNSNAYICMPAFTRNLSTFS